MCFDLMSCIISLVLYKHSLADILDLLDSISKLTTFISNATFELKVFVNKFYRDDFLYIDFESILGEVGINYTVVYCSTNLGFGSGHNYNLLNSLHDGDLFFIVNPDISFSPKDIQILIDRFDTDKQASCIAPLIVNRFGQVQYSAKKNPTFLSLLFGFIGLRHTFAKRILWSNQNRSQDYFEDVIFSTYLSGCFLAVRANCFAQVKGFDERFFLHLEDADICRRLSQIGSVYHFPVPTVTHGWARGSHKSLFQIRCLLWSYILYISKWGFDLF